MKIDLNDMLFALSYALDCVERDVIGVTTNHGKRVAYMSLLMGEKMGLSKEDLITLTGLAILHDNALTEFLHEEYIKDENAKDGILARHCVLGEENVSSMPFPGEGKNVILFHHENADGSGPLGKMASEVPLQAQIIHVTDAIDANWNLGNMDEKRYQRATQWLTERSGTDFTKRCVDCFLQVITYDVVLSMSKLPLEEMIYQRIPAQPIEYSEEDVEGIATLLARITDYKSKTTSMHSLGIAEKSRKMGEFYGYDEVKVTKLYLAGALHDIGKLVVDQDVLEKPDKLTDSEYQHIQTHAYYTYEILSRMHGLDDVTAWAAHHHEKLNGKGYPFGLTAEQLSKEERLMAVIDIYQALTESRTYKEGFSHEKTISILRELAQKDQIDGAIVEDVNQVFAN